jgi:cell division protein FtsQ
VPAGGEHGPVVSRPHLALVPANRLAGRLRVPVVRLLAAVVLAAALLVLVYAAARFTSLFALEELEVTGGRPAVREAVREAASPLLGDSLVALDEAELRRRLEAIPAVRSFSVDRAFPHTLRIAVVQERPLAVLRSGGDAWLVSDRGRVIGAVDSGTPDRRPIIWAGSEESFAPGRAIQDEDVRGVLEALRRLPDHFPEHIRSARAGEGTVTLVLDEGMEIRLGDAGALALKLAVAARVLAAMSAEEAAELAYLDVSVPERAVGGTSLNSQLEG